MNTKFSGIKYYLLSSSLFLLVSCINTKHKVYDEHTNRVHIDLSDTNNVIILKDFVSCLNCVYDLINHFSISKNVIIVSSISKSKSNILSEIKLLRTEYNVTVYFVFIKNQQKYSIRSKNRLFKKFGHYKSPSIIISDSFNQIKSISYSEYLELYK